MSSTTAPTGAPASVGAPPAGGTVSLRAGRWRLVLILTSLLLLGATLASGSRPTDLAALHHGLSTGEVTQVRLVGKPEADAALQSLVQVEWRDGLLHRRTSVLQVQDGASVAEGPDDQHPPWTGASWTDASARPSVRGDLATQVRSWTPTGELTVTTAPARTGLDLEVAGFFMPTPLALAALAWMLCLLFTLVHGPEPRMATRWAWFWLWCGAAPLTLVLYPVLGLPRAGRPAQPQGRRLTGGWIFLLAVLVLRPVTGGTTP